MVRTFSAAVLSTTLFERNGHEYDWLVTVQDDGDSSDDDEADEDESSGSLQPRPKPPYRQQRQGVGANQHIVVFDEVWNFQQYVVNFISTRFCSWLIHIFQCVCSAAAKSRRS
jgi:hypothetical protein